MRPPLAERLRPQALDEIAGQAHLVGKDGWIHKSIKAQKPLSILLFGPPGCGKTTLAKIYAAAFDAHFVSLSAVFSSISDIKKMIAEKAALPLFRQKLILFIDEIHRFNKAQQDAFLPFVENGSVILIGATTENPSFSLNNALLSRLRVLSMTPLSKEDLSRIIDRYETKIAPLQLTPSAKNYLLELAQGDGRYLLNLIENLENVEERPIDLEQIEKSAIRRAANYDKNTDCHHNMISALHKSIRGSDPDAALYWLCRMLQGGEDPLYITRRLIRMAVEDIGLADPQALSVALSAQESYRTLGLPEGELALAQAAVYLALAPKSNALYIAFQKAADAAQKTSYAEPPKHILNAQTALMRQMGYGKGYIYDHDTKEGFSGQNYFPEELEARNFYEPKERGFEREMKKRAEYFAKLRAR